ncbi:SRPBCC family protein [Corallococcus aberystwythensis]|uniref:Polyketide cyclase n=1 Tax=Corallococcus aberystwythensis TaxID=2316722 RepID=A0A3A8R729_9BACT|nr:SRPBCC family protein [Corallococcus aberystwythensis]RKH74655.1 polyketide cyclase [Corallococcus aberystwythensis]
MSPALNPELDLSISRIIKAPRAVVWKAWTDPASFEQWWLPAPSRCKVLELDLRPGGALVTHFSETATSDFGPHMSACFLAADTLERIVFTTVLLAGFRPAESNGMPGITAIITLKDHPQGTDYSAHVMHKNSADRTQHHDMGFHEGWGSVTAQLAALAERRV